MGTPCIYEIDIDNIRQTLDEKVSLVIPHVSVVSEMNVMQHWTKRHKRRIIHDSIIRTYWMANKYHETVQCNLPYVIVLTRIAPRRLDHDNIQPAFKGVVDTIADILIPGKKRGMADGDKRLSWVYDQIKGPKGIKIEIYAKC